MSWGRRKDTNRPYPKRNQSHAPWTAPQPSPYQKFDGSTVAGAHNTAELADGMWSVFGPTKRKKLMQAMNSERNKVGYSRGKDSEQYRVLTAWIDSRKKSSNSIPELKRRKGEVKSSFGRERKEEIRVEAAKDLGLIVVERNPVVRIIKDGYDTADALERLRTGRTSLS